MSLFDDMNEIKRLSDAILNKPVKEDNPCQECTDDDCQVSLDDSCKKTREAK